MVTGPENAQVCFARLMQDGKRANFKRNLEFIRKACDEIINLGGFINYSRVAEYCQNHFGSPVKSTIYQSERFKLYINIRKSEHEPEGGRKSKDEPVEKPRCPKDPRMMAAYIVQLENELVRLNNMIKGQKILFNNDSRANPIDYKKSISMGAMEDGSMHLVRVKEKKSLGVITEVAQIALEKLFKKGIEGNSCFKFEQGVHGEKLLLMRPSGEKKSLLFSDELAELRKLAKL